jgi:hypothetical protein
MNLKRLAFFVVLTANLSASTEDLIESVPIPADNSHDQRIDDNWNLKLYFRDGFSPSQLAEFSQFRENSLTNAFARTAMQNSHITSIFNPSDPIVGLAEDLSRLPDVYRDFTLKSHRKRALFYLYDELQKRKRARLTYIGIISEIYQLLAEDNAFTTSFNNDMGGSQK